MWIYIKVTRDRFEHIIALADTISELAKECGTTQNSISSSMSHAKTGKQAISRDMAQKIAQALGTTVKALEGEEKHG